eukprot:gene12799-17159_t
MAGRGRGATLPAWMTDSNMNPSFGEDNVKANGDAVGGFNEVQFNGNPSNSINSFDNKRYDDRSNGEDNRRRNDRDTRENRDSRGGKRSRSRDRYGSNRRSKSRSRDRGRDNRDSRRGRSSSPAKVWIPRKNKLSNFDIRPPEGVELPPIAVQPPSGVPNSYFSYANTPVPAALSGNKADLNAALALTRHARRIYAGGIPPRATEEEIHSFFNEIVSRALKPMVIPGGPVLKVYLNSEKCYAFVEFPSVELCTACMQLDNIKFEHFTGTTIIRVRRPMDYRPELLTPDQLNAPIPKLNLDFMNIGNSAMNAMVGGPGKIFIGGLPYNLPDEQVKEILEPFGPIRAFHQVRDPGAVTTKGYAFCEFVQAESADIAIAGLNGLKLGDKTLSVRLATLAQGQQQSNPLLGMMSMGGMSGLPMGMPMGMPNNLPMAQPMNMYGGMSGNSNGGMNNSYANSNQYQPQSNVGSQQMGSNSLQMSAPTRILKLSNMVTHAELEDNNEYADIKEDVRLECNDYGRVLSVVIPRIKDGFPPSAEGFIYVEFADANQAKSAALVLNGRKFADKTVIVDYFSETNFANGYLN